MNIFLYELKANRKTAMIWTVVLIGVALMYLMIYPSFTKDMSQVNKMIEGYPLVVRKAMGLSMESFSTLLGFYGFVFTYITLCGSIQAMNIGTSILSKEIREKTADFLMTKPVSRVTIMTSKLLAAFCTLVSTNAVYLFVVIVFSKFISKESFDTKKFILITLTLILIQLMFMAIGIIISVIAKKIKSVISITISTVFGFFIISMLGSVIGDKAVRYITPFKFYDTSYIIKHAAFEGNFIIFEAILIVAAILLSYVIYMKKDIHAV